MFDFTSRRFLYFLISGAIIVAGLISAFSPGGLKWGIEFEGGMSFTATFSQPMDSARLDQSLADIGYGTATVQQTGKGEFFIRTPSLETADQEKIGKGLKDLGGSVEEFNAVSPIVAKQTIRNAGFAVAVACLVMLLYIAYAFRRMPRPFRFAGCAIVALVHDVLMTLGVFSFVTRALNWEIDPMFMAAVLAILGYSINNTIVIYDRIRENTIKGVSPDFGTIVNISTTQSLTRCLNSSVTTILALVAVYAFVGGPIRTFSVALVVGLIAGTWGAIFICGPLLLPWRKTASD
ncbi:MAG: protein translocase subunit SecF [Chloroflexota bacterium]